MVKQIGVHAKRLAQQQSAYVVYQLIHALAYIKKTNEWEMVPPDSRRWATSRRRKCRR